jgi:uncharacterized protein (TIGR00106 family)
MFVAFLIVSPLDQGPSLSRHVKKAIDAVRDSGLDYQLTPMGTVIQSRDLEEIFQCARAAVEAVRKEGSDRISLSLKVDIRYDKDISFETKIDAVK